MGVGGDLFWLTRWGWVGFGGDDWRRGSVRILFGSMGISGGRWG